MPNRPKARTDQLLVQRTGQDTLVYDERTHRAHSLDARAARVWELCDGARTEPEIAHAYGEGAAGEAVVSWTLAELEKSALLEDNGEAEARAALSRRALMRTVGLAAIPVIMAITAPRARAAVSSCSNGGQQCSTKPCCPMLTCDTQTFTCQ
jgi:Coenzyme PQQ synthesis protein D (PqqD)